MRLSKKAEYALRALAAMARGRKSWSIHDLSAQERIPVKFLEQILLGLRNAGVLASKRGVGGGYVLAKASAEITLGEIVRALDGPFAPVPCAVERPAEPCTCPDPRICPVRLMMAEFRRATDGWLDAHTLEDLARLAPGEGTMAFDI
jgi:Rrf2 family transcriptional regulator, iron-sulfur cluster assembly transcription factor